jgi:hypothetical protein
MNASVSEAFMQKHLPGCPNEHTDRSAQGSCRRAAHQSIYTAPAGPVSRTSQQGQRTHPAADLHRPAALHDALQQLPGGVAGCGLDRGCPAGCSIAMPEAGLVRFRSVVSVNGCHLECDHHGYGSAPAAGTNHRQLPCRPEQPAASCIDHEAWPRRGLVIDAAGSRLSVAGPAGRRWL